MTAADSSPRGPWRVPILVLVIGLIAGGALAGRAHAAHAPKLASSVDAAERSNPGALSTAWYCPGLPTTFPLREQTFTLSNLGSTDADAVVTVQPDGGAAPVVRTVSVPHESVRTFNRATLAVVSVAPNASGNASAKSSGSTTPPEALPSGPIVVEPFSPDVVVESGIESGTALEVVPCANTASTDWYFAAGTTVRGVSQWLVLDDPFSTDARVDVTLLTDSGIQLLPALQGMDVPGRSRIVVPIHQYAVRQSGVSVTVHADVGRVVASQTLDYSSETGPPGVASALGALAPSSQWWFTDGEALAGASQVIAISDPSQLDAHVVVQAITGSGIVQPVVLAVPSGTVSWVQIGGCKSTQAGCVQVPTKAGYELSVQSDAKVPIVAETLSRFTDNKTALGATTSMGSTTPALEWVIARTRVVDEQSTSISLMNAGVGPAHVSVEVVHDGAIDRPDSVQNLRVDANARVVLPADIAGATHLDDAAVVIKSDAPIFAESTIYGPSDATRVPGIPTR